MTVWALCVALSGAELKLVGIKFGAFRWGIVKAL